MRNPSYVPKALSPESLLIPDEADFGARAGLNKHQVREDIELLLYSLRTGYGGRTNGDQKAFQIAIQSLKTLPSEIEYPATSKTLLEKIDAVLLRIPDNHLHMESLELGFSEIRQKSKRRGNVGPNVAAKGGRPWTFLLPEFNKSLPILSINYFPPAKDEAWKGFKSSVEKWLKSPAAVLDLRGNHGGSDNMVFWLISRIKGAPVKLVYSSFSKSLTPETMALKVNSVKFDIMIARFRKKTISESLKKDLVEATTAFQNAQAKKVDGYETVFFNDVITAGMHKSYKGRLFILVDAECESSCESLVQSLVDTHNVEIILVDAECESSCESLVQSLVDTQNVEIIGENTAGTFHFGNIGLI
ncbi:MAG: hypothetical protein IPM97_15545 [Bdellovibrionaceae bacterium]|nr:hypothetical protein [Pseudobdellovibrionaceae bacterium]